jgi:hypothetical protein
MERVPPIGILSAKSGKIHFILLAIITAEAVVTKHIASQDRNSQRSESGYVYLAKLLILVSCAISNVNHNAAGSARWKRVLRGLFVAS